MKLLVVEDEAKGLTTSAKDSRRKATWSRWQQRHRRSAWPRSSFDLIVLDTMLPGIDGLEPARRAAPEQTDAGNHADGTSSRGGPCAGLKAGADDYPVKPFAFSELAARIEGAPAAGRRRSTLPDALVLSLGDLEVDLARRRAVRARTAAELSAKEFQLLTCWLRRKGEVLSRTEIAEQVWDVNFDHGTNVIDVAIRRLRGKLDLPFDRRLLHRPRHGLRARGPRPMKSNARRVARPAPARWLALLALAGLALTCLGVTATSLSLGESQAETLRQKQLLVRHLVAEAGVRNGGALRSTSTMHWWAAGIWRWC